jgi:predicted signal transduction protein with EAL and GGDEF domain
VCARIGGDEFGVLLRGADAADAASTARRIARALGATTHADGSPAHIGACIGIATADGSGDAAELVHRADIAMFASKSTGKGRISSYDPSLPRRDLQQAAFERELAGAAENGQLVVHYQPVVSYPGPRCTAVEALVRWQHPERGLLYPDLFIHTAERTGAIRSIGSAVLRESLRDVARWRRDFPEQVIVVHVNVSALQLEDDDLLDQVRDQLEEFSLGPEALVLEVTESLAISSPDAVRRLHALAEHGVVLAIDDFGTGYSALQTLRTLPIRIVKIDRSFVAGSSHNPEDRAVAEAIVHMADQLGLSTIAEGVEEPDHQAFVESIGATGAQGYLYRRPGTAEDFTAWFADHLLAQRAVPHQMPATSPPGAGLSALAT